MKSNLSQVEPSEPVNSSIKFKLFPNFNIPLHQTYYYINYSPALKGGKEYFRLMVSLIKGPVPKVLDIYILLPGGNIPYANAYKL